MSIEATNTMDEMQISLGWNLTIQNASELKEVLTGALEANKVSIDGGKISQIDTASLQVLLAFAQDARARSIKWTWNDSSDPLKAAASTLDLVDELSLN